MTQPQSTRPHTPQSHTPPPQASNRQASPFVGPKAHSREFMIADILVPLSLHYPHAGYDADQIAFLAQDWCEDLACYPPAAVRQALKLVRRRERFFPCLAVFTRYVEEALRVLHITPDVQPNALPPAAAAVDWEHQKRMARNILARLKAHR